MTIAAEALDFLGYQQLTGLSSVKSLTVPAGCSLALVTPSGQPVRWRADGTDPTASVGYPLAVGAEVRWNGANLAAVEFIETAASATLDVVYFGTKTA